MTDDDPAPAEPPVRHAPLERPPRFRADPAVMRETLDAARRRLGPDDTSGATAPSAERQRALLREAAASHAAPLTGSRPATSATPPSGSTDDSDRDDANLDGADPDHEPPAGTTP